MNTDAYYYGMLFGCNQEMVADLLDAVDPFALSPAVIIERVVGTGYSPDFHRESRKPFLTSTQPTVVDHPGHRYLVSIDLDRETIPAAAMMPSSARFPTRR